MQEAEVSPNIYLVTGATGFVGGVLVRRLLEANEAPRVMLRSLARAEALRAEFGDTSRRIEFVQGDLRDRESLSSAVRGVTGVYHVAAVYRETTLTDKDFFDINTDGTRALMEESERAGVKRFVHCSTGGVLGDIKGEPGSARSPYAPDDVYQESKTEGEKIARAFFDQGRLSGAIIRPAMVYGPGDVRFLKLFRAIARKRFLHVGPGTQWVHYVDVRDLVEAFYLAMHDKDHSGSIYCIAGRIPVRFKDFVALVAEELGVSIPSLHIPLRPLQWLGSACEVVCKPFGLAPPIYRRRVDFFAKNRIFDIGDAERELGYSPRQDLRGEIRDVIRYYRQQRLL
jgi:nucleoside-diphosphate-sugar epimerase